MESSKIIANLPLKLICWEKLSDLELIQTLVLCKHKRFSLHILQTRFSWIENGLPRSTLKQFFFGC